MTMGFHSVLVLLMEHISPSELVIACCILHNICEIHGDEFSEEWLDGVDNNGPISSVSTSTRAEGNSKDIRSALMTHFNS